MTRTVHVTCPGEITSEYGNLLIWKTQREEPNWETRVRGGRCNINVDFIVISCEVAYLVGKPEGKRPLGRPGRRWMDNIKKHLLEIGLNVVDWIGLAQDRYRWRALVNSVMNLRVP
jgi:hypothetical protein